MPILNPHIQFNLCEREFDKKVEEPKQFLIYLLKKASENLGCSLSSMDALYLFKKNINNVIIYLNSQYKIGLSYEKDFNNPSIFNIYDHILKILSNNGYRLKNPLPPGDFYLYEFSYDFKFFKPDVPFNNHRWYFTNSPIAILCVNLLQEQHPKLQMICDIEANLMQAIGYTLIISIFFDNKSTQINDFILKTIKKYPFAEIHLNFNIIDDKSNFLSGIKSVIEVLKNINSIYNNTTGYFYLYFRYIEIDSPEFNSILKTLKKKQRFRYFTFSRMLHYTFEYCKIYKIDEKFNHFCISPSKVENLQLFLSDVLLYNSDDSEHDLKPYGRSGLCIASISREDFLVWKKPRVRVLVHDIEENCYIEKFVNFEDIHLFKMDHFVTNTLYLTKANTDELEDIFSINPDDYDEIKKKKIFLGFKKDRLSKMIAYISFAYSHHMRHFMNFDYFYVHHNQIFALLKACKFCLFREKKSESKGIIYQVETGEGKSCIIRIIAAALALSSKTVHITTSNIYLANRDYYESCLFYQKLGIKAAILLHYNELPFINMQNHPNDDYYYDKKYYPDEFFAKKLFDNSSNMNFSVCGIKDNNEISKNRATVIFSTFINFECLYLRMMEMCPGYVNDYFSGCSLLIDEADSILIDEISNGTILSRPMKTKCEEILKFIYLQKMKNKTIDYVLNKVKEKWPKCEDIKKEDIEEMFHEIDTVNEPEFMNGKKYSIEEYRISKDKTEKKYKIIVPFDYDHKGILEPNKEFGGFIQQFIAIKEKINNKSNKNLKVKDVSMNYLYVSHPIFVKLYDSVCGFTGTIGDKYDKKIYKDYYQLTTMKIPRNKPNGRIEYPTILTTTIEERNNKIVDEILFFHEKKYPVLVIFQDLNEIHDVFDLLISKGIKYINVFDGKDENIKPDFIAGRKGEISLGTNSCGRGTDIKNIENPLHVIVTYYTTNTRVIYQAFGRTARQGNKGSVRIICLESQYFSPTIALDENSIKIILNDFLFKNNLQTEFIEEFRQKRKWIFDNDISTQKISKDYLKQMKEAKINVNRINVFNIEYPICISIKSFLIIQAQKIFSLFNCPNCKFTWMLFQRYLREVILESWSIFIESTEKKYRNSKISMSYHDYLNSEIKSLKKLLNDFLNPKNKKITEYDYGILPTFMNIYNNVVKLYENKIMNCFPHNLLNNYNVFGKEHFCSFSIGFKPYSLIDKSGARINTLDNPDQEQDFICDPELIYLKKQPKGYKPIITSITKKIDDIFNLICKKINEVIGNNIGLKFFLRRTLGGCEFGVCFDFDLVNFNDLLKNDQNCFVDKDPLFIFTICVKSMIPILAGILIIGLVYIASLANSIFQWISAFEVKITGKLIKKTVKIVLEKLASQALDDQIDKFCNKIFDFLIDILKNQIEKLKNFLPDMANLFTILLKIAGAKDFENAADKANDLLNNSSFFKKSSNFGLNMISDHLPVKHFLKLGFILLLCFASFMMNFYFRSKALKYHTSEVAKKYDEKQNTNEAAKENEKYVKNETKNYFKPIND